MAISGAGLLFGGATVLGLLALAFGGKDAKAGGGGGGGGGGGTPPVPLEKMTCNEALGLLEGGGAAELAKPAKDLLATPVTPELAVNAQKMAIVFRTGAPSFPEPYAGAMRKVADCLDDYAKGVAKGGGPSPGVQTDDDGVPVTPDGGPAIAGVASNPNFQWLYAVQPGDNAWAITAKFWGPAQASYRYRELVANNETAYKSGRYLGSVGDYNNPNSSGYNWKNAIVTDDRLKLPKSWNTQIDQTGVPRGNASPYPKG